MKRYRKLQHPTRDPGTSQTGSRKSPFQPLKPSHMKVAHVTLYQTYGKLSMSHIILQKINQLMIAFLMKFLRQIPLTGLCFCNRNSEML